jgi:class 3 adenylate cyclase
MNDLQQDPPDRNAGDPPALHDQELRAVDRFCRERETAILAVMFTDLKGSSGLAEKHGEIASQELRHTHDKLLRAIVERDAAGAVLKNIGDSLLCVFSKPTEAVARAVEIQQALAAHNASHPQDQPIEVRIGIHMGQVVVEDVVQRDIFGRHVNRAARVESLADGGQILVSHSVYDSPAAGSPTCGGTSTAGTC